MTESRVSQLRDQVYLFCRDSLWKAVDLLCRLVPASPKYIWFESEIDFAENTRALYEYMQKTPEYQDYHMIWCVEDPSAYKSRKNTLFLKRTRGGFQYSCCFNRCKYILLTHPFDLEHWKKSQVVINTWHGNPFKAPNKDPLPGRFDYMLASSEDGVRFRRKEFSGDFEMVILGAPRLDWLFEDGPDLNQIIDTEKYRKIIYCMPTYKQRENFSDSEETPTYSINVVNSWEELTELNRQLQKKNVLLVCIIHHLQKMDGINTEALSNILYLRDEDYGAKGLVMNQMIRSADALVTDFSGVFLDYILLDRPIGFFCNTTDLYTRGFTMENPEDYMPGPHIETMEQFLSFIDDVVNEKDDYREFRRRVCRTVHKYRDNCNCRRFLNYFHI